jgi:hypothetical protein
MRVVSMGKVFRTEFLRFDRGSKNDQPKATTPTGTQQKQP